MADLRRRARGSAQRGTVTAEAAIVLPVVAVFCLAMLWMISLGIAQIRVVDAARDGARSQARGDSTADSVAAALANAPSGARVEIHHGAARTVTATVTATIDPPRWILLPLPSVTLDSASTVEVEDNGG